MKTSLQTLLSLKYNLDKEVNKACTEIAHGNLSIEYKKGLQYAINLITHEAALINETIKSVDWINQEVFGNINPPANEGI